MPDSALQSSIADRSNCSEWSQASTHQGNTYTLAKRCHRIFTKLSGPKFNLISV